MRHITTPIDIDTLMSLRAGEKVLLSGELYTGRDAAHKRMFETLMKGEALPVSLEGQAIYYVGPAPAKAGQVIGPAGPTTSGRMDKFTPALLEEGLKIMIGKGRRDPSVIESMKENKAVYMAAIGGAAAIMAQSIQSVEVLAYHDLGTEAIRRLTIKDMPLIVAIDAEGNDYYDIGPKQFLKQNTSR